MKEQKITFETAKLAKDKGFKGYISNYCYYKDGSILQVNSDKCWNSWPYTQGIRYSIPTQSLLQQWLYEKHNWFIYIEPNPKFKNFDITIFKLWEINSGKIWYGFNTPSEALEKGLYETLKLI